MNVEAQDSRIFTHETTLILLSGDTKRTIADIHSKFLAILMPGNNTEQCPTGQLLPVKNGV